MFLSYIYTPIHITLNACFKSIKKRIPVITAIYTFSFFKKME